MKVLITRKKDSTPDHVEVNELHEVEVDQDIDISGSVDLVVPEGTSGEFDVRLIIDEEETSSSSRTVTISLS